MLRQAASSTVASSSRTTLQCAACCSRGYRTAPRRRRASLQDREWQTTEKVLSLSGLNVKAANHAHDEYYSNATPSQRNQQYERHLTRWAGWRTTNSSRRPSTSTTHRGRSFHTSPRNSAAVSDPSDTASTPAAAQVSVGDFVEIRTGAVVTYGIIMATPEHRRKGPLRETGPKSESQDLLQVTRFYLLNTNGLITLHNQSEIVLRYPFKSVFPQLNAQILRDSALLEIEIDMLATSEMLIPGRDTDPQQYQNKALARQLQRAYQQRISICASINRFMRQVEVQMEDHRMALLDLMAQSDRLEQHYIHLTTDQVATMLDHKRLMTPQELVGMPTPTPTSRLTTHQLLMNNHHYFLCDEAAHVSNSTWTLRPARERNDLQTVHNWLNEIDWLPHQAPPESPISTFVNNARHALSNHGKVDWTSTDKTILSVLLDCFSSSRQLQPDIYRHVVSTLLKAFDFVPSLTPGDYQQVAFSRFRSDDWQKEPGVLSTSNQDLLSFIKALRIFPEHITDWSLLSGNGKRVLESALSLRAKQPTFDPAPFDDLDEHIRTDFSEDVFVIDDPTARELDDGISLGDTEEGKQWVHVHIADPTCNLEPDDVIAQNAFRQSNSLYFNNGSLPLLYGREFPGVATKGADGRSAGPSRVLTFSALLDDQGLAHKISIRPRTVDKQHIMSYDGVQAILAGEQDHQHGSKLRTLNTIAHNLRARRARDGGFIASGTKLGVDLKPASNNKGPLTPGGEIPFYFPSPLMIQDPSIVAPLNQGNYTPPLFGVTEYDVEMSYSATEAMTDPKHAQDMVAEFMILAGRVAAAWASRAVDVVQQDTSALSLINGEVDLQPSTWSSNPLALPYRTQTFPAEFRKRWLAEITRMKDSDGRVVFKDIIAKGILLAPGGLQADPAEHVGMGIGSSAMGIHRPDRPPSRTAAQDLLDGCGYARMTSPLRRYNDLVAHWQIKAILHRAMPRQTDDPALSEALEKRRENLMSRDELDSMVQTLSRGDRMISALDKNSRKQRALKAVRMELERAELQQSLVPVPTPGRPGKNTSQKDVIKSHPVTPSSGSLTLSTPPKSALSSLITSSSIPAYIIDPLMQFSSESGRTYLRILIPSLGLSAFYPLTTYVSASEMENIKKRYTYIPPRESNQLEREAGGRYMRTRENGALPPRLANVVTIGKEFYVRLKHAREEVVGGVLLAGRSDQE
ncbi:unnamed protein product [Sympodiomycopsis kandeliae]